MPATEQIRLGCWGTDGGWRHTLNNVQGGAALALGVVVGAEAGVTLDEDECSAEARRVSWSGLVWSVW